MCGHAVRNSGQSVMDPLDGIAAFARVVENGSFSAAAHRLGISKSAVSAHVQRLEERLGTRLLNRTTRHLSVTEAGAAYYRHCACILAEAEAAEQAATALQREPRGTLRISAPDSFGCMHVAPAVPAFLKRYPDLAIDISLSPAYVNLVDERLDLAIRIGVLEDSPLVVRKLAPSRLVLCAAPAYLRQYGAPRAPDELAKHNCLCTRLLPWGDEWRLVLEAGEPPASTIYAVFPGNRLMSMKVRAFVDHLARCFGRTPYWDEG